MLCVVCVCVCVGVCMYIYIDPAVKRTYKRGR